jgi:uncharacterized protein (DUF1330 family)
MAVYMVIEAKVKNQDKYKQYISAFSEIVPNYGGRCLVRGGRITPFDEGIRLERRQLEQMVILEFPSEVNLRRCVASPEYQSITSLRQSGAQTRMVLLEGSK